MTAGTVADDLRKPSPSITATAATTYVALIQQYLNLLEHANALWLAERCVAEYPDNLDAVYLQALCHYRMGKIQNARAVLERHNTVWSPSMCYLAGQCCYELREYNRSESVLLRDTRDAYQKSKEANVTFEEWIVQTSVSSKFTSLRFSSGRLMDALLLMARSLMDFFLFSEKPCPVPNGAAGLALLGKIYRKSDRLERAIQYFRMSLQLDPFLFTSFQALAEMGVLDLDATVIFGGSSATATTTITTNTKNNLQNSLHHSFMAPSTTDIKTPLQPMEISSVISSSAAADLQNIRSLAFDTPGLTPIHAPHKNNHDTSMMILRTPILNQKNSTIVRRARVVASRQYYPPSPETATPVTTVTRSMRYLRGLGGESRSLFSTSENRTTNPLPTAPPTHMESSTTTTTTAFHTDNGKPDNNNKENDEKVQDILDVLTIAGNAYQHICQYRCNEALACLQQLPSFHQRTAWVLHQQGRAYLEQGNFLSAQRCLESMHKIDPGRVQGLELLSTVYWQLKKEIELANLAQRVMDWDYESPEAHCVSGNCFSLQKDHVTALVFFRRSLQIDPDFTYTHTLSGYEYMSNEDFDKATACFRQALRTDKRHYNAWYGLGAIYYRQEKYDLAEYHFERAVALHPCSSVLRCNLGMAQYANGKAYQALETLSEAFRLDPRNPQARYQRATIFSALHRPEEALVELKVVRDAAPREATVHFAMGKVLKRLGRRDEAMKCFLTAMDLDPKDNQMIKSAMDKLDEPEIEEEGLTNF